MADNLENEILNFKENDKDEFYHSIIVLIKIEAENLIQ